MNLYGSLKDVCKNSEYNLDLSFYQPLVDFIVIKTYIFQICHPNMEDN